MANAARIREANQAIKNALPSLDKNTRLVLLAQAMQESDFGDIHKTPTGESSYNWGNVYAEGDLGTVPVGDTQDGVPFTANAAWNSSDEVGAKQLHTVVSRYVGALDAASKGDLYGYAKALFRNNLRPYYGGFPPGHKYSLAPKGVDLHSDLDHYWRVVAYKRYVESGVKKVAAALGESYSMKGEEPKPPPKGVSSGWAFAGIVTATTLTAVGLYGWQAGWYKTIFKGMK